MNSPAFQLNKVLRLIKTQGKLFWFKTSKKNEFGEPNGETVSLMLKGVYHQTPHVGSGYVTKTTSDASTTRVKSQAMILALWEDAKQLKRQDTLSFNGKSYQVNEVTNLAQANLVADISLEEVQT